MKILFDFIPAILFLAFYLLFDIYAATKALMVFVTLQLIYEYFKHGKVSKMVLVTFLLVIPFGAITLFLHDDFFIKLKFSVFYWVLAIALLASQYFYKKNLVEIAMQKQIEAPAAIWQKINMACVGFLIAVGMINLYFVFYLPKYWIYYKFPGVPIAMMIFMFGLFGLFSKQIKIIEPTEDIPEDKDK
jgi:intracellular septation protein